MSLTFVHTADWHLGRVYRRLGPRAAESAKWRLEAVQRIFDLAAQNSASFIVVAGDVFDTDLPSRQVIRSTVELLQDAPAPVVLMPGHHDYCAEGSVWFHPEFADALKGVSNIHLARAPEPIEIADSDTLIFPCPVASKQTRQDLTSWIPEGKRGERPRIGLAHGGWQGYYGEDASSESDNAIDDNCTERCGLDYLALGDYHSYTPPNHPAAKARAYYAGTPECGDRADRHPGYALVVNIPEPGAEPTVQPHFVGRARPRDLNDFVLHPRGGFDELQRKVEAIENPEATIVRAKIRGCLTNAERKDLEQWLNEVQEKFLGADICTKDLYDEPGDADFLALNLEMPERRILEMLNAPLTSADLAGVKDNQCIATWSEDEVARREARTLFYMLLQESSK